MKSRACFQQAKTTFVAEKLLYSVPVPWWVLQKVWIYSLPLLFQEENNKNQNFLYSSHYINKYYYDLRVEVAQVWNFQLEMKKTNPFIEWSEHYTHLRDNMAWPHCKLLRKSFTALKNNLLTITSTPLCISGPVFSSNDYQQKFSMNANNKDDILHSEK